MTSLLDTDVHYRTGSPGQLGLRVAGSPGQWVTGSQNVTQFYVWFIDVDVGACGQRLSFGIGLNDHNLNSGCCRKVKVADTRLPSLGFPELIPELIPVLGSQPAGDVSHKPGGSLPLLSARPAVTLATLRGLLPTSLLGGQRHSGCEQFA